MVHAPLLRELGIESIFLFVVVPLACCSTACLLASLGLSIGIALPRMGGIACVFVTFA